MSIGGDGVGEGGVSPPAFENFSNINIQMALFPVFYNTEFPME